MVLAWQLAVETAKARVVVKDRWPTALPLVQRTALTAEEDGRKSRMTRRRSRKSTNSGARNIPAPAVRQGSVSEGRHDFAMTCVWGSVVRTLCGGCLIALLVLDWLTGHRVPEVGFLCIGVLVGNVFTERVWRRRHARLMALGRGDQRAGRAGDSGNALPGEPQPDQLQRSGG